MKTQQLQIRLTSEMKEYIRKRAAMANMDMSEWALSQLVPSSSKEFRVLISKLAEVKNESNRSYAFAAISDFLDGLKAEELTEAAANIEGVDLDDFCFNYLAAMVEYASHRKNVSPPSWIKGAVGVKVPFFGSELTSLRLHLLTSSPPPFRKRNIFIDSSVGDRV